MLVNAQKYLPYIISAAMLMAGYAVASDAVRHTSGRVLAEKIRTFEAGKVKAADRRFNFENYSFASLDDAVQKLFPPGTPLSRVDAILRGEGKAVKSEVMGGEFVDYTYTFAFDRWTCSRTVAVKFDPRTKRVISARGNGRCD